MSFKPLNATSESISPAGVANSLANIFLQQNDIRGIISNNSNETGRKENESYLMGFSAFTEYHEIVAKIEKLKKGFYFQQSLPRKSLLNVCSRNLPELSCNWKTLQSGFLQATNSLRKSTTGFDLSKEPEF